MSDTTSVMNNPSTDQIKALQTLEQSIRKLLNSFGVDGGALPAKKKRASKKAAAAVDASDEDATTTTTKPKREINPKIAAMNEERKAIFAEMKDAWSKANPSFATMSKDELKKAITEGKVAKPPGYPDALKEHSKRMGEKDPAHAEKAAARRKAADDKKSQKSDAASDASAKLNDAASDASATKKKRGPKKLADMTTEERAAHEAKKAAKKALKDGAPASAPAPVAAAVSAPVSAPSATVEVITGEDDDPETLVAWSFQSKNYFKNELGFVYEMVSPSEPGAYVGRFGLVKGKRGIDTSVPEPDE
jgi:colicin import membrane protein